jgi:ligand-binding sensor domain-containing protein
MQRSNAGILAACCLLLILSADHCHAQEYRFINYTHREGLPNTHVQCLLQDRTGYIWIGTQDGLFRYDGYSFRAFYHNDRDTSSILLNSIDFLYEDKYGLLWVGTNKGASSYDPYTQKFTNYERSISDPSALPSGVSGILEDKAGTLWFATGSGYMLCRFNRDQKTFSRIKAPERKKVRGTHSMTIDRNGIMYVGLTDSLITFDPLQNKVGKAIAGELVAYMYPDAGEKIYFGYYYRTPMGVYDVSKGKFEEIKGPEENLGVSALAYKSQDELWITTLNKGFGIYNKRSRSCTFIKHHDMPFSIVEGKGATCLLKDRSGTLWIGFNEGLSKLDPRDQIFTWNTFIPSFIPEWFMFNKFIKDPVSTDIYAIAESGEGLYVIDRPNHYYIIPCPSPHFAAGQIQDIMFDRKGNLWVLQWHFLYMLDRKSRTLKKVPLPTDMDGLGGKAPNFLSVYEDRESKLWISSYYMGLHIYDPVTGKFEHITKANRPDFIIDDCLLNGGEDPGGNLWFYSHKGFAVYNKKADKFTCFKRDEKLKYSFEKNDCRAMAIDNKGNIWLGTYEDGICRYVPSTGTYTWFTNTDGLCNNEVGIMLRDKNGHIWIGTKNGVSCLDPEKETFTNYTEDEGLPGGLVGGLSIIGDTLFLGLRDVFCTTRMHMLDKNSSVPPVVINSFKVFDMEHVLFGRDAEEQGVQLSYMQNHFSFEFAALNYTAPGKNKYAYMLEGYDKDWIYSGNRHFASYTYVPAGRYTFRVKASNNDGVWNETGVSVPLEIIPPFWETWWFRLFLALLIPSLIIFFVNRRIRFIKMREKEKSLLQKQLAELEMKALRAQMNPHFIFNALNSIQQQIVTNDTDNAFIYLDKFARLLRMILDHSEHNLVSLRDELKGLQLYIEIEALRFQHSFEYSIDIAENVKQESIKIPGMLLQPYVENAIWHGLLPKAGMRRIHISIRSEDDLLFCTIEDNGVGREAAMRQPKKHLHESKGLHITAERLNLIGKIEKTNARVNITDLKDSQGNALGTRVELAIPIIEEYEKNIAWIH